VNGGAIYVKNSMNNFSNDNNENNIGYINDNVFISNEARNYGGAIYSEYNKIYLIENKNNTISYNKAGIDGGGIYSSNIVNKNLFDINQFEFINNTVNSFKNEYSSLPYYIVLNTKMENNSIKISSGDYLPLSFSLYDEYNNILEDMAKYYSIALKISLYYEDNKDNSSTSDKIILNGNREVFVKGILRYIII